MDIDAIFLDMDGVLVDTFSRTYETDCEILRRRGKPLPNKEAYRENPHRGDWNRFYAHLGISDGTAALEEFYNTTLSPKGTLAIPGVAEMIAHPHIQKRDCAIISISRDRQHVLEKLASANLAQYFKEDEIYVSQGDKTPLLREVTKEYLLTPQHVLFVTDTSADIRAGNQANVVTVAIANEYSYETLQMLKAASPTHLLKDIRQLPQLIKLSQFIHEPLSFFPRRHSVDKRGNKP